MNEGTPLLEIVDLSKHFHMSSGSFGEKHTFKAVDKVSLKIFRGQTFGLVGESGCGKSTLGKTILKLYQPDNGKIFFKGKDVTGYSESQFRSIRKNLQIIFQDPYASLNPKMSVRSILEEPLRIHKIYSKSSDIEKRIFQLLDYVKMPRTVLEKYPHEFSGGQRQRICIAKALSLSPELIVCDESVSALDVSIQAQVINILMDLKDELGVSYLFISHDLKVVKFISDYVAVMYFGKIVEKGPVNDIYNNPRHPYTQALLSAIPQINVKSSDRIVLQGDLPSPMKSIKGCLFESRCNRVVDDKCSVRHPDLVREGDREFACYNPIFDK